MAVICPASQRRCESEEIRAARERSYSLADLDLVVVFFFFVFRSFILKANVSTDVFELLQACAEPFNMSLHRSNFKSNRARTRAFQGC